LPESPSKLDSLFIWWDESSRSAAEHLAVDEALLDVRDLPILRFYRWQSPAVTTGYFQRWRDLSLDTFRGSEIARRWTGGGLVDHRHDLPYSLIVPAGHWLATVPAVESYRWIHAHLAQALRETTPLDAIAEDGARDDSRTTSQPALACFTAPVAWDVTDASSGQKISGAAQRRSRRRLLHQGSVIVPDHAVTEAGAGAESWRPAFARLLSSTQPVNWSAPEATLAAAARLANDKYQTVEWRERY